ncbi:DUF4249 domain-containing protein [Saccharicrinis sp. FJH62]|uniref:DUF4249 domain-containing protein n=1 Tax=Saccharicrinis sp. FJH62 TaxID=3344657 RepID=UPI0035D4A6F4
MRISIITIIITFLLSSCIEPFMPDTDSVNSGIVINGSVENREGYQFIYVSKTSLITEQINNPVSGCTVFVDDNAGNGYYYDEIAPGVYQRWYAGDDFVYNRIYTLHVKTPEGEEYESAPETLAYVAELDTVMAERGVEITTIPKLYYEGLQFTADVNFNSAASPYVLFELTETWEFEVPLPIDFLFDDSGIYMAPNSYKQLKRCWKTQKDNRIYLGSLAGITGSTVDDIPLQFVTIESSKLQKRYSVLVKMKSISSDAYIYFEELKKRVQESGSLYETQPSQLYGNIKNINNEKEKVLGYFFASGVTEKRYFINNDFGFRTHEFDGCILTVPTDIADLNESLYPYYLSTIRFGENAGEMGIAQKYCFDCILAGGTTLKPDFWNE